MNYIPRFIENKTIEELRKEENEIYENQYKYGRSLDRPRLWDITYTIKILNDKEKENWLWKKKFMQY